MDEEEGVWWELFENSFGENSPGDFQMCGLFQFSPTTLFLQIGGGNAFQIINST